MITTEASLEAEIIGALVPMSARKHLRFSGDTDKAIRKGCPYDTCLHTLLVAASKSGESIAVLRCGCSDFSSRVSFFVV